MSEEVKTQQPTVKDQPQGEIDAVKHFRRTMRGLRIYNPGSTQNKSCLRCGKSPPHAYKECPAVKSKCKSCDKVGHWSDVCRSKTKRTSREISLPVVGNITSKPWKVVNINNTPIQWKLDSGANVSVLGENVFQKIQPPPCMTMENAKLIGPGGTQLQTSGKFQTTFSYKGKSSEQTVHVMEGKQEPLLGRPAMEMPVHD